tara:strand:+ start:13 stop:1116 length:1104 start_codon:yes stop_codon:yes gene_type:complete
METVKFDALVIGAGVVGLAIARKLSLLGLNTILIEKETRAGEGTSSRNSGVVHAGMYYSSSSLKAKLCVRGNEMMYEYCAKKNVPIIKTGKVIIAKDKWEHSRLIEIYKQGLSNQVKLDLIAGDEVNTLEPEIECHSGIFSKNSGIVDVPSYVDALENDLVRAGGLISYRTKFLSSRVYKDKFKVLLDVGEEYEIEAKYIFNCSGLFSEQVSSSIESLDRKYIKKIVYAKGQYFKYHGKNPFNMLVYPLPGEGSLGIHLGWDMSRQLRFGPDLVWVETLDYSFEKNSKERFLNAIESYWPNIDGEKLQPDYVGIRPKIFSSKIKNHDFNISFPSDHQLNGFYNLQGIESPGLTSSLAIADYVSEKFS